MTRLDFEMAVKRALRERDMTMLSLAKELGISSAYLSDIVKGNRKANPVREKIVEILEITLEKE